MFLSIRLTLLLHKFTWAPSQQEGAFSESLTQVRQNRGPQRCREFSAPGQAVRRGTLRWEAPVHGRKTEQAERGMCIYKPQGGGEMGSRVQNINPTIHCKEFVVES